MWFSLNCTYLISHNFKIITYCKQCTRQFLYFSAPNKNQTFLHHIENIFFCQVFLHRHWWLFHGQWKGWESKRMKYSYIYLQLSFLVDYRVILIADHIITRLLLSEIYKLLVWFSHIPLANIFKCFQCLGDKILFGRY